MNSIKRYAFALAIVIAASFTGVDDAVAQNAGAAKNMEKEYVLLFGNAHRDTAVVKVLYENAPNYFNAPDMPRFAIVGKDRKFYLGIGGYVKGTLSFDMGHPITSAVYFEPSTIPMNTLPGNRGLVQFSAATSNLFFNIVALPHTKNQVGAYINFNFSGNGNNYGFSLRAAYLTYRGFLVGYNSSLFTDGAASAPTIDQQGPNAMTFVFNTVLDYQYAFNKHWKVGAGLELPIVSATYNNSTYAINQRVPDIPFYGQYSWADGNGWVRLSGLLRNMFYRNTLGGASNGTGTYAGTNEDEVGFGVKVSGAVPFTSKITMFYQGVYGKGISSYIQDVQGYGLDMVPVAPSRGMAASGSPDMGKLKNVEAWGAYLGVQWQISPKFLTSATYSMVETYLPKSECNTFVPGVEYEHNNAFMPNDTYKSAKYVVANLFYTISPAITTGIEYLWGCRKNVDGTFKQDNRIQTALRVNF